MRLIDAEALRDDLAVLMERNDDLIDEWFAGCIEDTVDEQPTISAIESAKLVQWINLLKREGVDSKRLVRAQMERELARCEAWKATD